MMTETMILMAAMLGGTSAPATTTAIAPIAPAPALVSASLAGILANPAPILAPTRVAERLDADAVVLKVQAFYGETKQYTAVFRQTVTNTVFGTKRVSDGKVWIKKPGKMRWDYKGKKLAVEKSFISDGTTLWAVEHDMKQVFVKELADNMLPVAISFLYGKGDLGRDFSAKLDRSGAHGTKADYVVELTPRTPSAQYKKLFLVVDASNFRVKESIIVEASDNTNHFQFYSPDTEKEVKDSWFYFNVKSVKDYRLVKAEDLKK